MAVMDDTPIDRPATSAPHSVATDPGGDVLAGGQAAGTGDRFEDALRALAAADPAQAPELADAIAERLGAVLAEEDEDADTPQA
jgi:hypothetical protein